MEIGRAPQGQVVDRYSSLDVFFSFRVRLFAIISFSFVTVAITAEWMIPGSLAALQHALPNPISCAAHIHTLGGRLSLYLCLSVVMDCCLYHYPPSLMAASLVTFVLRLAVLPFDIALQAAFCSFSHRNRTPYPIVKHLLLYSIVHRRTRFCLRCV